MKSRIHIQCDSRRLERVKERRRSFELLEPLTRPPVYFGCEPRFILDQRGIGFLEYFSEPRIQAYHQVMNLKWVLENVPDDRVIDGTVCIWPDWQNTMTAGQFGAEIVWQDDQPPRVLPMFHTLDELMQASKPDLHAGLSGKKLEWIEAYLEIKDDFEVFLNGEPMKVRVETGGWEGPVTGAFDLCGDRLLIWMVEEPEAVSRFLSILTEMTVEHHQAAIRLAGVNPDGLAVTADGGELVSPSMFRRIFAPHLNRLFEAFPGWRIIHNCGRAGHLLRIFRDELKITEHHGITHVLDLQEVRAVYEGKVRMIGGLDIGILLNGTPQQVKEETKRVLTVMRQCPGFALADGYNIPPRTPLENLRAAVEAVDDFAGLQK